MLAVRDLEFRSPFAHPHRRGRMSGVGQTQSKAPLIGAGIAAGAGVAEAVYVMAAADPEPLTKAALFAVAALAVPIASLFEGCGETCIEATHIVNEVEPYLAQNRDNFLAGPKTASTQQAALALFDDTWQKVLVACGNASLGDAGRRCISERQAGGVAPWCPNPGHTGCDWFILYRDPIANATVTDSVTGSVSSISASLGLPTQVAGFPTGLLLGGGLLLGAAWMMAGD